VLQSVGSVGDAYDNSIAESCVDTFKTELISDRVWRTRSKLELAIPKQQSRCPSNPARLITRGCATPGSTRWHCAG